jgi:hypothetical protein
MNGRIYELSFIDLYSRGLEIGPGAENQTKLRIGSACVHLRMRILSFFAQSDINIYYYIYSKEV